MSKRLVKIAKELNVGTSTIVEHLSSHGFEIENKPTAKITEEMYNELLKEFQKSIAIKEKADQLVIGNRVSPTTPTTTKKEASPPFSDTEKAKPSPPKVEEVKQPKVVKPEEKPVDQPETVEKVTPKLKVLGKIDLSSRLKGKPDPKETKEEKNTTPQPDPVAKVQAPKEEKKPEPESKASKPVEQEAPEKSVKKDTVANSPDEKVKESPTTSEKEEKQKVEANKEQTEKPKQENEKVEKPVKETVEAEKPQGDEIVRAEAPELRGLKILGKIDTDKLKRPKKKKKTSKDETPAKKGGTAPKTGDSSTDGTKEKPKSSEEDQKRRRKRRRKKVSTSPEGSPGGQARSGSGGNRKDRRSRGGRNDRSKDEVKEVSQKEIEEKIKATMARISGGGKKKRQRLRRDNRERLRERQEQREMEQESGKLQVTEFISVQELANLMDVAATDVIMTCMNLGVIVSINQRLDAEIIELVAEEYGHEIEFINLEDQVEEEEEIIDDPEDLLPRAPIVTVMGHVDHGKTSLLDYIRKANVVSGEAGGITQHIGAYEVKVGEDEKRITFLDTPGHEAFTAMRARGAKVTDIAVIIVAADDNVMPQTKEAISHAQAAGVPIVFAINKVDKPDAQPERIKQELANMNLLVEEWGGKYQSQDISAKTGMNIDELLEKILLEAELLELKANPDRVSSGTILEASLDKGRGYVTKMLVQTGTLAIGDIIVAGEHSGRVKAMFNERGKRVKEAGPSAPVLVLGLSGAPQAGERFKEVESDQEARQIASKRAQILREQANRATKRISLDEIGRRLALGNFKELNLIVKGDVDGSVEALSDSLIKQSVETIQVNVIHKAVGQIIESDVLLASASDAIIIGFQVRPSMAARKLAEREGVEIKTYSIIYEAIEEIRAAMEGMLEPTKEEKTIAEVEVREVYKISKVGTVAGCYVLDGKITRNTHIRLIRNGIVVYPTREGLNGEISSLKRFKDDVREVKSGMECGISIKNFNDIKAGDIIEGYEVVEIQQKLDS